MTIVEEEQILQNPIQMKLVDEILKLAENYDILDAYYATWLATEILEGRLDRASI